MIDAHEAPRVAGHGPRRADPLAQKHFSYEIRSVEGRIRIEHADDNRAVIELTAVDATRTPSRVRRQLIEFMKTL